MLISSTNKTIRFPGSVNDKSLLFGYNANSQYSAITRYANLTHSGTTGKVMATTLVYDFMNRLTSESTALGTAGSTTLLYSQRENKGDRIRFHRFHCLLKTIPRLRSPHQTWGNHQGQQRHQLCRKQEWLGAVCQQLHV